jgi:DNA-binding NarL/FixJ family response regulator
MKKGPSTIAIVDDNAIIRESVKHRLNTLGYNVVMEAENGQVFLDQLYAFAAPDICVLDINMPVMDGLETAYHLKKKWPEMKIIFFSMEDNSLYMNKGIQLGVEAFVPKRVPFVELEEALLFMTSRTKVA